MMNGGFNPVALFFLCLALAVAGFVLFMLRSVMQARNEQQTRASLQARFPDAPWKWRQDWASGRIESEKEPGKLVRVAGGLFWILVSLLIAIAVNVTIPSPILWILFLLPCLGLWFLVSGLKEMLRERKFGRSHLELGAEPFLTGERLRVVIQSPLDPVHVTEARATLSCILVGAGDESDKTLWQDERALGRQSLARGPRGARITVEFDVPGNMPSTGPWPLNYGEVSWQLRVTAMVPGIDYQARFELPVFNPATASPEQKQ